jgi:hypothetical protein
MGLRGLKAFQESQESNKKYLRIKDGQKFKIRPLQELDESAKNFDPDLGVALFTKEWQHPTDFTRAVVDDSDPQGSVGQELLNKFGWHGDQNGGRGPVSDGKGGEKAGPDTYRPKYFGYVNVLVDDGENEPYVAVLKGNTNERSVQIPRLISVHENSGSITDRWFVYSAKGENLGKTYSLEPLDKDAKDKFNPKDYIDQLHDLDEASPRVPYDKQMAVLRDVESDPTPQRELVGASLAGSTEDPPW